MGLIASSTWAPPTAAARAAVTPPLQQTKEVALAVQLQATSDDQKVHSVETDLELAQCPQRLESPTTRKSMKHLDAASSDPTTNPKPPTVIPLMLLFQRDGPCEGRLKKTSSGQEKKKKIK